MSPEQKRAHARMLSTLPVHTVSQVGIQKAEMPKPVHDVDRPIIILTRYRNLKSAASSQRVQVQTIREWIKSGRAVYADE